VNQAITNSDDSMTELDRLSELTSDVLRRCKAKGASEVDLGFGVDVGLNVSVRLGKVESIEHNRDRGLSLTVFFGKRKGSGKHSRPQSGFDREDHRTCLRHRPPYRGGPLQWPGRCRSAWRMTFPISISGIPGRSTSRQPWNLALRCEAAGREHDARISNSEGATVQIGSSLGLGATSHGFFSRERDTRRTVSVALLAEDEAGMQRDYWYETVRCADDFPDVAVIGRKAAERTVARLAARKLSTRQVSGAVRRAEVARSLVGSFISR
jgi:PmbA protein